MIVHRRHRGRRPHEAHDAEALERIAPQEVLGVAMRRHLRRLLGQPVVLRHQPGQQLLADLDDRRLVLVLPRAAHQRSHVSDESAQAVDGHGLLGRDFVLRSLRDLVERFGRCGVRPSTRSARRCKERSSSQSSTGPTISPTILKVPFVAPHSVFGRVPGGGAFVLLRLMAFAFTASRPAPRSAATRAPRSGRATASAGRA